MKHVRRFRQKIESRQEKGVEQGGEGSCSPASAQNQISTSPPVAPAGATKFSPTSIIPAKLPLEQAGPSDLQSVHHLSMTTLSIQPADQPTVSASPPARESADLWKLAYEKFRSEQPDLADNYDKHVLGDTAVSADLSSRESVQTALNKLLEDRERKQWKISVLGYDIKIRAQVGRLIKIL